MNISMEQLIEIIVREVAAELQKRGIAIEKTSGDGANPGYSNTEPRSSATIDLHEYTTPVLTERQVLELDDSIREIIIPRGTIITPGARDVIKHRSLIVSSDVIARR